MDVAGTQLYSKYLFVVSAGMRGMSFRWSNWTSQVRLPRAAQLYSKYLFVVSAVLTEKEGLIGITTPWAFSPLIQLLRQQRLTMPAVNNVGVSGWIPYPRMYSSNNPITVGLEQIELAQSIIKQACNEDVSVQMSAIDGAIAIL